MSWQTIDTVRCTRCAVFTPTDDLAFATDGSTYCVSCGPPPVIDLESLVSDPPRRPRNLARSPLAIAAAAVAFTIAGFFVAACASQL